MSVIDSRIVQMKFDNNEFASKVKGTISDLNTLDSSIEKTGKNGGMRSLSDSINQVASNFNAMKIIGITALANITNSAVNAGKRIASALTIDPLKSGFAEYQEQMDSTMVIMSNTGDNLATVTEALDELNVYADKTVYSFSQMTNAIGKFAAAGVNLDDSVAAIKGLSNAAALVGAQGPQLASAYYNLSQSLQMGYLQTIDYNSLANSTIFNKNMRDIMVETAIEMGKFTKESAIAKKATEDFKGSLQDKWLTSDIILKALEKYSTTETEIGKQATAAATEVRSFKQLVDTAMESIGTGWADTWKIIFGDLEEAKALWTSLSQTFEFFSAAASNARLSLLKGWKEAGGRTEAIRALFNVITGVTTAVKSMKEGFHEIFPPVTSQQLVEFTRNLKKLSEKLILNQKEQEGLKNVVATLAKPLKVVVDVLKIFGRDVAAIIGIIGNLGKTFLYLASDTENFKRVLQNIIGSDRYEKLMTAWSKITEKFSSVIENLKREFEEFKKEIAQSEAIQKLLNSLKGIPGAVLDKIISFFTSISNANYGEFPDLSKILVTILETLSNVILGVTNVFSFLADGVGTFTSKIIGAINWGKLFNIVFGAALAKTLFGAGSALVGVILGFKKLEKTANATLSIPKKFSAILGGITKYLKAKTFETYAEGAQKLAISIAILAGSLVLIASIDTSKLWGAVGALVALSATMGGLTAGLMVLADKMTGNGISGLIDAFKIAKVLDEASSAMLKMAASVLVLAFAIKILGSMQLQQIVQGVGAAAASLAILGTTAALLAKFAPQLSKGASSLLMLAVAVRVLVPAIEALGSMDIATYTAGIENMAIVMLVLGGIAAGLAKLAPQLSKGSIGLVALAAAVRILVPAIEALGQLSLEEIGKGILAMAGSMTVLGLTAGLLGKFSPLAILGAAAMLIMATAVRVLVPAIEALGQLSMEEIGKSLLAMAGSMAALGIVAGVLSMFSPLAILGAAAMLVMAVAVRVLVPAIQALGQLSMAEIGKSILAMAGSMLTLGAVAGVLSIFSPMALLGAAAILVMAVALRVLTPALESLVELNALDIVATLVSLAGGLITLGSAAGVLGVVSPLILAASVAFGALGLSLALVSPALLALSVVPLSTIGIGLSEVGAGAILAAAGGVALIAGAAGVIAFAGALTLLSTAITLLGAAVKSNEVINDMFNTGAELMSRLIDGVESKVTVLYQKAVDAVQGFVNGIKGKIREVASAGIELAQSFVAGLSSKNGMDSHSPSLKMFSKAKDAIAGWIKGITGNLDEVSDSGVETAEAYVEGVETGLEKKDVGASFADSVQNGINQHAKEIIDNGGTTGDIWIEALKATLADRGQELTAMAENMLANASAVARNSMLNMFANDETFITAKTKQTDATNEATDATNAYTTAMGSASKATGGAGKSASEAKDKFEELSDSLQGSVDIFKAYTKEQKVSSEELLYNISTWNSSISNWSKNLAQLQTMGFEEGIIQKLAEQGTASAGIIDGLLEFTDQEIAFYNKRYKKSLNLADEAIEDVKKALPELTETVAKESKKSVEEVGHATKEVEEDAEKIIEVVEETTEAITENEEVVTDEEIAMALLSAEMNKAQYGMTGCERKFEAFTDAVNEGTDALEENKLSATDEAVLMHQLAEAMDKAQYGTEGYIEVLEPLVDGTGAVIEEMTKEEEAMKKLGLSLPDLEDMTDEMADSYLEAVFKMKQASTELQENIKSSIESALKPFEEFDRKTELTADKLLSNMRSQVQGILEWQNMIKQLEAKGASDALIQDLASMGPTSYETVKAFVDMSAEQLKEANNLYTQQMGLSETVSADLVKQFEDAGMFTVAGFVEGITGNMELATNAMYNLGKEGNLSLRSALLIASPSQETYKDGQYVDEGFANGVKNGIASIVMPVMTTLGTSVKNKLTSLNLPNAFRTMGERVAQGLAEGIRFGIRDVVSAAEEMAKAAEQASSSHLQIHSPSRLFAEQGMYTVLGYAQGIKDYARVAEVAAEDMGNTTIDTISETIKNIGTALSTSENTDPVIRPVLDLTEIQNGVSLMDSMLNKGFNLDSSMDLATRAIATSEGGTVSYNRSNVTTDNKDVVSAITQLRTDVSGLSERLGRMQVVMDSGALVGEIVAPMDDALGQRMIYNGRGV